MNPTNTVPTNTVNDAAKRLRDAYTNGAIQPLRDYVDPTDADTAYQIQQTNTLFWLTENRNVTGWKIGLTAKAVQAQLGVDQPDFGVLFADMHVPSGDTLELNSLIQPRAEAEIALCLKADLDTPNITAEALAATVEWVAPAIEIVDSRIADWRITFADTVADNGSSARYVLGAPQPLTADTDLFTCGMVMQVNDSIVSTGVGAACLGHPLNAAAWLANTLIERGQPVRSGAIILTGALGPMVDLLPNSTVNVRIGGLGEASFYTGSSRSTGSIGEAS